MDGNPLVLLLILAGTSMLLADGLMVIFYGELAAILLAFVVYGLLLLSLAVDNLWFFMYGLLANLVYLGIVFMNRPETRRPKKAGKLPPELEAILNLLTKKALEPGEIADELNLYPGIVNNYIHRLREGGYVEIIDGKVCLTREGKRLLLDSHS